MSARSAGSGLPRVAVTADGSLSFAHAAHGELAHSRDGAWTQARLRYAAGCGLRARGFEAARRGAPVRLLDVGTGLGWNLAAALAALSGTGARLEAVSLERDLAPVRLAAGLARASTGFPERCHRAVRAALAAALAEPREAAPLALDGRAAGSVRLVLGDARATLPALPEPGAGGERFDAVFLDPFSPRVEPALWEPAFLAEVARRMAPGALLATYSAASAVRAALAAAGLGVARGPRVGRKREGTLAGPGLVPRPEDSDLVRRFPPRPRDFSSGGSEGGVKIL